MPRIHNCHVFHPSTAVFALRMRLTAILIGMMVAIGMHIGLRVRRSENLAVDITANGELWKNYFTRRNVNRRSQDNYEEQENDNDQPETLDDAA